MTGTGLLVGWALAALLTLSAIAWILRSVRRRTVARRDVVRIRRVAQAFDVNPADADILTEVALLGGPLAPALATTDRRVFDAGAALYLVRIYLEGGDIWNPILALSRLRQRLGFEEDPGLSLFPAFLSPVTLVRPGGGAEVQGIVVDRRGAMRVVVKEVPEGAFAPGDPVEVRAAGRGEGLRFRLAEVRSSGDGATLILHSWSGAAGTPRAPALLPVVVRRPGRDEAAASEEGTILDLSVGGACVRLPSPVGVNEKLGLTLRFGSETIIELEGTTVWTAPSGGGRWRAGVRFEGVPDATRREILAFLSVQGAGPLASGELVAPLRTQEPEFEKGATASPT
ncbi:MAG TPA: PilZ domain-containing protein [Planctomycetota bacterium]|nr:PilZ domain-containing protein [Planctomycetota bacterium]